jgi:hydrogenase nickel incorporation protein HypA/HybF
MHELSIATNVVETVIDSLSEESIAAVKSINISIGIFSGVDPSSLEFCLPLLIENGPLEKAEINIEVMPLVVSCHDCRAEKLAATSLQCPECRSSAIEIISGKEIQVTSVDVECPENTVPDSLKGVQND